MRRNVTLSLALLPFVLLLGWAAAGVAQAGGGCHGGEGTTATEGSATVVKIDGCTFAPSVTRVPVGTEVTFLNTSVSPHDVTGRNREWGTASLDVGESYSTRFRSAGVYPYSCSLHPGMAGVVVVGAPVAAGAADTANAADITPVSATTPAAPVSGDNSPIPYLAAGGLGLLAGLGFGAALVSRRRRPA
jgi:MYXO-CTERM domain-containing protein